MLRNKRGHNSERPAHRDEEWPPLAATRESPRTETKTQHSQKLKKKKKKWISDVNIRSKNIKPENIGVNLHDLGFGNRFLDITHKQQ